MVETVRGEVELAGEAVELYFHVGLDYVRVEGDGEHGDVGDDLPCVPGHLLVLVLFLQGVWKWKVEGEEGGGGEEGEEDRRGGPHPICGAENDGFAGDIHGHDDFSFGS